MGVERGARERTPGRYQPRRPTQSVLYRCVQQHLETWLAQCRDVHDDQWSVLEYMEREFRRYLDCGILARGFARARCEQCGHDFLIAFSCKGRGVCPSCNARRMVATAAHLTDHVLPDLPVRQWVLAVPKRLRYFLHPHSGLRGWIPYPSRDSEIAARQRDRGEAATVRPVRNRGRSPYCWTRGRLPTTTRSAPPHSGLRGRIPYPSACGVSGRHGERRAEGAGDGDHRRARAHESRRLRGRAVGYVSFQDDMDTAIAIRTALVKDGTPHVQAGAGIVHDSVPESEWTETQNKARALLRAADMVQQGLDAEA